MMLYRFILSLISPDTHCPCLGNLGDNLHIQPATLDTFLTFICIFLFLGALFSLYREKAFRVLTLNQ